MRRRVVLALIGSVAVAWPLPGRAQQPERMRRIAMLTAYSEADASVQSGLGILAQRLEELGWRSHSNMRVEVRWGDADGRKIPSRRPRDEDFSQAAMTPARVVED